MAKHASVFLLLARWLFEQLQMLRTLMACLLLAQELRNLSEDDEALQSFRAQQLLWLGRSDDLYNCHLGEREGEGSLQGTRYHV
jgi:hypothetical protein